MADQKKLDRWAEKLLDTGKRNNLINFKDTKASTADVLYPDSEKIFSKCSVGHTFEVYDPNIPDEVEELGDENANSESKTEKRLSKAEYRARFERRIRSEKNILVYGQTANPLTAVKNIAKKAKGIQDETGINVAYLAFGFVKWKEKENSDVFYRAPLLLVHINIITGSSLDAIKIEVSDDDVVVNPTFSYQLQAAHGLSLPEYEDGESLETYYNKVLSLVRKMGWDVIDECKIGIFSFQKINMYEDLKNHSDLILENGNICALLGDNTDSLAGFDNSTEIEHVVENPLIDLHTVVDADSSQIEAIEMAKSGKSFVLQGPPGTGKSQTITNIIAECLHDGKKILFVSEKQAALNVVFDKLKKAGLEDFCLELHSHKANKKAVINELIRTLELRPQQVNSSVQEEIRQKQEAQQKLDAYAKALHKKRDIINKSLYELFELYAAERENPELRVNINSIGTKGQDYYLRAIKLLEQYVEYVPSVGENYRKNVWFGFNRQYLTFEEQNQLKRDLELLSKGYKNLQQTTTMIKAKYETPDLNFQNTLQWQSMLSFSAESDVITPSLLSKDAFDYAIPYLEKLKELSTTIIPQRENILKDFSESIVSEIDGKDIYTKLNGQFSGFFSRFGGEYKTLIAGIQLYAKNKGKLKYQQALEVAKDLMNLQSELKVFKDTESTVQGCLGACYQGPDTDWEHTMAGLESLKAYFRDKEISFGALSRMNTNEFTERQEAFREDSAKLSDEILSVSEAKKNVTDYFDRAYLDLENDSYEYCIRKLQGCLDAFDRLGNWRQFTELLGQLERNDLTSFIDQAIEHHIAANKITGAFKKNFYNQWIEYIIFSVPELSSFSRINQDQAVRIFGEKDRLQYDISKYQIKAELSQQRPNLDLVAGGSAVAVLRREGAKKRKQMPIRKLLGETGNVVQIIKPCFLMSPLSVSTFLDPEKIAFDTVIFDEASQIFPQDAVGAIYRGKQLIVVGDSKQMPPSNFFNASIDNDDDNDEDYGDIADFESILDICSSVFTTERLAWHYRSHYEQLIAFSNMNFYSNNLVTFPSSAKDHTGIGVDYYYVDGIFDRKSKTNRKEAEFIVDLVYKNIEKYPKRSLGVVAFSKAQQDLIDKLLSKRREMDPSHEAFFKEDVAEPFFIKNLETVQGDERDTIIFSVAYAKDSQGRFIHNFGPLNREGGERRLNVAVTRAKDNVQLVASIHYTDINLNNTNSEGARLLRAYLDYAQNGEQALERAITVSSTDHFDSYFEEEVCDFLRDQGFTVDTQVGCSGYRIDLGIRKPDSSNYVLAVECDGATYHSSKNARDRDSLRQSVLERMGWQFYRIWSTDWYRNKTVEKERLVNAAKMALATSNNAADFGTNQERVSEGIADSADRFVSDIDREELEFPEYVELDARQVFRDNNYVLKDAIIEILKIEAPLSEEYLLKRFLWYFRKERVSKSLKDLFKSRMSHYENVGVIRDNGFLYLNDKNDIQLRVPGDKRDIKYIAIEELADGLYALIQHNVEVPKDSLFKELTNILGFSRTGESIYLRFNEALDLLKGEKLVKEEDGVISLQS